MKNQIFKTLLLLFAILMVTGCEENIIKFDSSMKLVGFSSSSVTFAEDAGTGDVDVFLGASAGSSANVSFTISTDGINEPAIEGTHYTVSGSSMSATTGESPIVITIIDNDTFGGDKQFRITLTEGSDYTLSTASTVLVTIADNEHPLKQWIGTYDVAAASYGDPGNWDEAWVVTTAAVEGDITKISMLGIGGGGAPVAVIADIDTDLMTITIEPGQDCGNAYGYDYMYIYYGFEDLSLDKDLPLTGTIAADGTIMIDNWGHNGIYGGDDYGTWDVFNTTWTMQ